MEEQKNIEAIDVRDTEAMEADLQEALGEDWEDWVYARWAELELVNRNAEAEAKAKEVKADLEAKAKKRELRIPGGVTLRWGIITAGQSDMMAELLGEYADESGKLQQEHYDRSAELAAQKQDLAQDFQIKSILMKLGRAKIRQDRATIAVVIKGFTGALHDHNPDAADLTDGDDEIRWPRLPLDDWREALDVRLRILSVLDRDSLGELQQIVKAHMTMASGLTGDESGN